jgi:hypothetical protein
MHVSRLITRSCSAIRAELARDLAEDPSPSGW